jgi:hypothetical protein
MRNIIRELVVVIVICHVPRVLYPAQVASTEEKTPQATCSGKVVDADGRADLSLSTADFYALSEKKQHGFFLAALKDRVRQMQNVAVAVQLLYCRAEYADRTIGKTLEMFGKDEYEFLKVGDSYKFVYRQYLKDGATGGSVSRLFESRSAYDAESGVSRMLVDHRDMATLTARIDRRHVPLVKKNWYGFFLSGNVGQFRRSYISYILDYPHALSFERDAEAKSYIVAKTDIVMDDGRREVRRFWFDPAKDFLMTKVEDHWEVPAEDGKVVFVHRDVFVRESREVSGTWMPVSIVWANRSEKTPHGEASIYDVKVSSIKFGSVKPTDLEVVFPKGTEVNDMVRQVRYVAGREEEAVPYGVPKQPPSLLGKPLPDVKDLKLEPSSVDMEGKMILMCFWDMQQRPSRNCIMQLAKQAEQLKQNGVTIVAVQASQVDENALNEWVKQNNIPFAVGMIQGDPEETGFAWGVRSLPWPILTDAEHIVRAEGFGLEELDEKIQSTE